MLFADSFKIAFSKRQLDEDSAIRIFHGPGEGNGIYQNISIDKFGAHAWVSCEMDSLPPNICSEIEESLMAARFLSASIIFRKKKGEETQPSKTLFGAPPESLVIKNCGLKFLVKLSSQRQPGLFLDLNLVRDWLLKNSTNKTVLNLFSYTGSLSVASGAGGASHVLSIDLSKNYSTWAQKNWELNGLQMASGDFVCGDVFDWLNRFHRKARLFDVIVCDPPSFSRTKKATFSTTKNSQDLHEKLFNLAKPSGIVITSINTETISKDEFLSFVKRAAKSVGRTIKIEREFGLPPEYPTRNEEDDYLKGALIKVTN